MLSKNKIKLIQSLDSKKGRMDSGLFIVEGDKMVEEIILSTFPVQSLFATAPWFDKHQALPFSSVPECEKVTEEDLKRCSFLKTPSQAICLVKIPHPSMEIITFKNNLTLLLDTIQDPGNLGTIIRIADWFGISQIVCSTQTADVYNPKVVQSTMGAISRVKVFYLPLEELMPQLIALKIPIFGTTLDGENIYTMQLPSEGCILMGNESKGITPSLMPYLSNKLFIPFYPPAHQHSESLNVSVATGIICAEFRRQHLLR